MRVNLSTLVVTVIVAILVISAMSGSDGVFQAAGKPALHLTVPYWFGSYWGKVALFTIFALVIFFIARLGDPNKEPMTGGQVIAAIIITILFSTFIISLVTEAGMIRR